MFEVKVCTCVLVCGHVSAGSVCACVCVCLLSRWRVELQWRKLACTCCLRGRVTWYVAAGAVACGGLWLLLGDAAAADHAAWCHCCCAAAELPAVEDSPAHLKLTHLRT